MLMENFIKKKHRYSDFWGWYYFLFFFFSITRHILKAGPFTRTFLIIFIRLSANWLEDNTSFFNQIFFFKRNLKNWPKRKVVLFISFHLVHHTSSFVMVTGHIKITFPFRLKGNGGRDLHNGFHLTAGSVLQVTESHRSAMLDHWTNACRSVSSSGAHLGFRACEVYLK